MDENDKSAVERVRLISRTELYDESQCSEVTSRLIYVVLHALSGNYAITSLHRGLPSTSNMYFLNTINTKDIIKQKIDQRVTKKYVKCTTGIVSLENV